MTDDLTRRARIEADRPHNADPALANLVSELADEVDRRQEVLERLTHALDDLLAERDAARAALERVRAVHASRPFDYARDLVTFGQETFPDRCTGCRSADYPCQTIRALEGKS